jgi:hypothetical protein
MKVWSTSVDFDYSWEEVSTASWQKYSPWNEKTPHVVAVDTLSRSIDPATGILRSERLITCKQSAPRWLQPFLRGNDTSLVYETSYVNPATKTLTLCSMNLTWTDILTVRETVTYSPSLSSPESKTQFSQRAEITAVCGGWQKVKNNIERVTLERFQQNALKGREGFEMVLARAREVFKEERDRVMADKMNA